MAVQSNFRGLVTRQQVAFYIQVHFYVYRFTLRTGSFKKFHFRLSDLTYARGLHIDKVYLLLC